MRGRVGCVGGVTSGKYKRQKAADTATGCHGQQGPTCDNLPSCRLIMLLAYNLNLFSSTENDSDHAMAFTHPNPLALCRWLEFTLCSTRNSVLSQWSDALSPGTVQPRRFIYLRFKNQLDAVIFCYQTLGSVFRSGL